MTGTPGAPLRCPAAFHFRTEMRWGVGAGEAVREVHAPGYLRVRGPVSKETLHLVADPASLDVGSSDVQDSQFAFLVQVDTVHGGPQLIKCFG